jgi:hypothetical protein
MTEWQVRAIELLAERYRFGSGSLHAHKVSALASSIFDQLCALGLLPHLCQSHRRLLVAAGYSHDVGKSVLALDDIGDQSLSIPPGTEEDDCQLVSFHTLRTQLGSQRCPITIPPLDDMDRSLLLYSVLCSGTSGVGPIEGEPLHDEFAVQTLGGILRIADGLDVRHRLMVQGVELRRASKWIRVLVRTFDEARIEVATAQDRANMMSGAIGLRVFVQELVDGATKPGWTPAYGLPALDDRVVDLQEWNQEPANTRTAT